GLQRSERSVGLSGASCGVQCGASAVNEKHANVRIALLADAAETSAGAGRELARCEPEPAGELATVAKRVNISHRGEDGRGGEDAEAGNLHQCLDRGLVARDCGELVLDAVDALLQVADLVP